jgi:rhomboid protease GluP
VDHGTDKLQFEQAVPAGQGSPADSVAEAAHHSETTQHKPRGWASYPATYGLLAVNIIVFILMLPHSPIIEALRQHAWGAFFTAQFTGDTLVQFGGCDASMVLQGQWWRLLTGAFVHGTFLHIAIKMWCLWNLGLFGEPLLGKPGLVSVYVLTGIAGNMLSLAWSVFTRTDALVVGASGAVFGIAGILIVLLSNRGLENKNLKWAEIRGLRSQVILFAGANLVLGVAPGFFPAFSAGAMTRLHMDAGSLPRIDNSAHLGGLLCGMALGVPLFSRMTAGKKPYRARQRATFAVAALLLGLFLYAIAAFNGHG